ncbi:hypothetical protein BDZ89DRAFT_1061218 [Hymenopellis radicata]|nr:hypothetical protein BDZ89DRAFT_1061218 [Hymenopellis radicata]
MSWRRQALRRTYGLGTRRISRTRTTILNTSWRQSVSDQSRISAGVRVRLKRARVVENRWVCVAAVKINPARSKAKTARMSKSAPTPSQAFLVCGPPEDKFWKEPATANKGTWCLTTELPCAVSASIRAWVLDIIASQGKFEGKQTTKGRRVP